LSKIHIRNCKFFYNPIIISFLIVLPLLYIANTPKKFFGMILLSILLIIFSKINKILFSTFIFYLGILDFILLHLKIHWGDPYLDIESKISLAIDSPLSETTGYLKSYIGYSDILIAIYVLFIFLLLYFYILKYKSEIPLFLKLLFICLAISIYTLLYRHVPLDFINRYLKVLNDNTIFEDRKEFLSLNKGKIINKKNTTMYDKIVIILGESVNKNHMSLYGYKKVTTPFLDMLYKKNELYRFNIISGSNQTKYSIPMILTPANVLNWRNNFINSRSIINDFKINNYLTYWISNQSPLDRWVKTIAGEADIEYFTPETKTKKTDYSIIEYFNEHKAVQLKELFVIHIMGSHFDYRDRIDSHYKQLIENPSNYVDYYDNTIYYTDKIIEDIYKYFKSIENKLLIIYISDHAEVIDKNKYGHGYLPTFKDEYEIPLVIYSSIYNPRIDELQRLNKKHYFNHENMSSIINWITGINNDVNVSYSSSVFSLSPRNIRNYTKMEYFSK